MKKILLLITLLVSFSCVSQIDIKDFKVTSQKNKTFSSPDRFDYQFKVKGDYGYKEIKLRIYANSISLNNIIGYIRWNREGDDYLRFNSYTTKSMWVNTSIYWQDRSFSTSSLKKFYLVAEYQGNSKTLLYTIPDSDTDGDGVLDAKDQCPFKRGLPNNNGCPLGKPDLVITKIKINGRSSGSSFGFKGQDWNDLCITIKNQGETMANSSTVEFILTDKKDVLDSRIVGQLGAFAISGIGPNESKEFCNNIFANDPLIFDPLSDYKYINASIDIFNNVNESNENNNSFAVDISNRSSKTLTLQNKPYDLSIYNLVGQIIINKSIENKSEEETLKYNLPKGLYFVKSENTTYKFLKN